MKFGTTNMASSHTLRPLLPMQPPSKISMDKEQRSVEDNDEAPSSAKRAMVEVACDSCRKRKSKCDGVRPTCGPCIRKNTRCVYASSQDQRQRESENLKKLFSYLKSASAVDADRLLTRLRSGTPLASIVDDFGLESKDAHSVSGKSLDATASGLHSPRARSQAGSNSSSLNDALPVPNVDESQMLTSTVTDSARNTYSSRTHLFDLLEDIHELRNYRSIFEEAVDSFHERIGSLFYAVKRTESSGLLGQVFDAGDAEISRPAFCELCAIAAIGAQYRAGRLTYYTPIIYNTVKFLLDETIEIDLVRAMKVFVLLALFNVTAKCTVALVNVDDGLCLAGLIGLYRSRPPDGWSTAEDWTQCKKVWRTLILCRAWVSATLGYRVSEDWLGLQTNFLELDENYPTLEDVVQSEMAKIAVIKANILRNTFTGKVLLLDPIRNARIQLDHWYQRLPEWLQLANIAHIATDDGIHVRIWVYYIHLLHLGSLMMLNRRIMLYTTQQKHQDLSISTEDRAEALVYVGHGLTAAKQIVGVLGAMMETDPVSNRCWMRIFQAYTSCTFILFECAQKLLHGIRPETLVNNFILARKALDVLEMCAIQDPVAPRLLKSLSVHYDVLSRPISKYLGSINSPSFTDIVDMSIEPEYIRLQNDYVFDPPSGETDIHNAAQSLLKLLTYPFENNPELIRDKMSVDNQSLTSMGNLDESLIGAQLEWEWENIPVFNGRLFEDASDGQFVLDLTAATNSGSFLASHTPFGWTDSDNMIPDDMLMTNDD